MGLPDVGSVTIVHQGGSRLTYPATMTPSYILLHPPMTVPKAFCLSDGGSRAAGLRWWTVACDDLARCRKSVNWKPKR